MPPLPHISSIPLPALAGPQAGPCPPPLSPWELPRVFPPQPPQSPRACRRIYLTSFASSSTGGKMLQSQAASVTRSSRLLLAICCATNILWGKESTREIAAPASPGPAHPSKEGQRKQRSLAGGCQQKAGEEQRTPCCPREAPTWLSTTPPGRKAKIGTKTQPKKKKKAKPSRGPPQAHRSGAACLRGVSEKHWLHGELCQHPASVHVHMCLQQVRLCVLSSSGGRVLLNSSLCE